MRLTEVSQMALEPGHLATFELEVGADGTTLPVSFDQGRHVGAGDRPGSWMALSLRLPALDRDALARAWLRIVARHGTLRTAFHPDADGAPVLHTVGATSGRWVDEGRLEGDPRVGLRTLLDARCRPYGRPSHRVCVVEHDDGSATVVIASDHAHVDMWSLAVLGRDLLTLLADPDAVLAPARPFADHTRALLDRPAAPDDIRSTWTRILRAGDDLMPRFPLPLGDVSRPRPAVVVVRDVLDAPETVVVAERARALGVRLLPLVLSAMTAAHHELAGAPFRAVFPVHSRYDDAWHDTVGWLITNSVIESVDPDPAACRDAVRASLALGSWPLADLLAPWGGMPETPGMFALSWLDLARLPSRVPAEVRPQYVSATLPTDGVMIWFVTDESGLHLRCRYPDTAEAGTSLTAWLDAVIRHVRSHLMLGASAPS